MKLNAPAANRFIKAALTGNDKFDRERLQRQVDERQGAHKRFTDLASSRSPSKQTKHSSKKRKATEELQAESSPLKVSRTDDDIENDEKETPVQNQVEEADPSVVKPSTSSTPSADDGGERRKSKEKKKRDKMRKEEGSKDGDGDGHRKKKSSKPPRDGKQVLKDLLGRSQHGPQS